MPENRKHNLCRICQNNKFNSEGDLQEQVSELQENLKAVREEVNAMKIGTTSKSVRTSNPIYHTLDEDGKVIEEKASDQEQEQDKITYNRFSIPGGGVNLNLRNRRDVAPSRKMGKRYVLLLFALFITSIVIAVVIAFVISKIQVLSSWILSYNKIYNFSRLSTPLSAKRRPGRMTNLCKRWPESTANSCKK